MTDAAMPKLSLKEAIQEARGKSNAEVVRKAKARLKRKYKTTAATLIREAKRKP